MSDIPADREQGTGVVNVDACLDILRDIVANADNASYLRRYLNDPFKSESYLSPYQCNIPAELIENAMKALGLPYPVAPKPRKVPSTPTDAQAAALKPLTAEGTRLVTWYNARRSGAYIQSPAASRGATVREPTVAALLDYGWIEQASDNPWGDRFHTITSAGREALARKTQHSKARLADAA